MLEKLNQLAEQAATNVSRRQCLGRLGRGAAVTVAALSGLLVTSAPVLAGRKIRVCSDPSTVSECSGQPLGSPCGPNGAGRCTSLTGEISRGVYNCNSCKLPGPKKGDRYRR